MALEQEEFRRRLAAARELIGCDQAQMGQKLKAAGLGVSDAKRLERGSLRFSDSHLAAYARITGLPEIWFEADDWRPLIRGSLEEAAAEAPAAKADLEVLSLEQNEALAEVHRELATLRTQLALDEAEREGTGG